MKLKLMISCAITFVCLLHVAAALAKLDFRGTWVLDKNRSFSNPPGLDQTFIIIHTGDQIKL